MDYIPGGYILLSRRLIESEIWDKPPMYIKVWIYLLSLAQHDKFKKLDRGQLRTSIPEIQEACSHFIGFRKETPSKSQIYRIIDWLRNPDDNSVHDTPTESMIETTNGTHGMVVTICNYSIYQDPKKYERNNEQNYEDVTTETGAKRSRNNINKNVKNDKELQEEEINNMPISDKEKIILNTIKSVDNYPFDYEKDLDYIRELVIEYPDIDILKQLKKWKTYKIDKPLGKKSNARLQIRNWMTNASKWNKKKSIKVADF